MNTTEILTAIKASKQLRAAADAGSDAVVAAAISAALPSVPKPGTFIGERGIYALLGATAGEAFLQAVEELAKSDDPKLAPWKRIDRWLKDSIGLDIGNTEAQATLASMSATNGGPFTDESVAAVLAFGSQPQVVTTDDVQAAVKRIRENT